MMQRRIGVLRKTPASSRRSCLFLILWLAATFLSAPSCAKQGDLTVQIQSPQTQKNKAQFTVEIADTPEARSQGLMFRQHLKKNQGMLFIFPGLADSYFWMENTYIPLDIIFVGQDKKILNIIENAEPYTRTPRIPAAPYVYVLEIAGGQSRALGIQPQDELVFDLKDRVIR